MVKVEWKIITAFLLLLSVAAAKAADPNGATETLTHYFHATDEVAIVAGPAKDTRDLSKLGFGSTLIFHNDVTVRPERDSLVIGKGVRQGVAINNNFAGTNLYLLFTIVFDQHEKYQGTRGYSIFRSHSRIPYSIVKMDFVIYKDSFNYKPDPVSPDW